ncbi:MAG: ATP-binding protein [Bacteroidales bacterium]|nr:ATP-binding protein [Bacteroidales bacterium]
MEKNVFQHRTLKRILITGPESTGKSELTGLLAGHYGGDSVSEYARSYIVSLGKPYGYNDVEHIARQQVKEYNESESARNWIFFDTWLIITKVWFECVYGRVPDWVDDRIRQARFDLVLLCAPDIPWIADSVRENGGEKRYELFDKYKFELDRFDLEWEIVTGMGDERFSRAKQLINRKA